VDDDRAAQVDREVAELVGGAHDAEDLGLLGRLELQRGSVVVRELDLVVAEERPRLRDRQGQRGIVDRVQPEEHRLVVAGDQRVAVAAEPDEPLGEHDDRVLADLDLAETGAVDVHGSGVSLGSRYVLRKSMSDGWMICAPARSAAW
jgi:hypothetical protein